MFTNVKEMILLQLHKRSRLFAATALAIACAAVAIFVSLNIKTVAIWDGGTVRTMTTLRSDTDAILRRAGISVAGYDVVENTKNGNYHTISIRRAKSVNITADGETTTVKMVDGSVADALALASISLDQDDLLNLDTAQAVSDDMHIVLDRVEYQTFEERNKIAYKVVKENTSTLKKGETQVAVSGQQGEQVTVYQNKIVNGQVVETSKVDQYVAVAAVDEKVLVGTKVEAKPAAVSVSGSGVALDSNGAPLKYRKLMTGKATGYSPEDGGYTATGKPVAYGLVAVDPNKIPYGTKLYITSADGKFVYGYAIAADTGGAVRSGKILVDLFFNTRAECRDFGRRDVNVYVLE